MMLKARLPLLNLMVTLAAIALAAMLPVSALKLAAAVWLIFAGPGFALACGWIIGPSSRLSWGEQALLGLTLGLTLTVLGGLGLYAVFGRLTLPALLTWYSVVTAVGSLATIIRRGKMLTTHAPVLTMPGRWGWALVGVLVLAAYFSFFTLSYSDWRGDEAEVVLRAVAVLRGGGQPLLSHTKGPAEILLAAAMGLLVGAFDELAIRLPFALASWLVVWSVYLLGKRLAGARAGVIAAILMLLNGWLLSHAHTVQYQPVVLLASVMAIWAYHRFVQERRSGFLWVGVLLLSLAALAHYDAVATGLPVLYLLGVALARHGKRRSVVLSLAVGLAIVLAFYLPFAFNAMQGETSGYLAKHVGTEQPYNNWGLFYVDWLTNNSGYYLLIVTGLLLGGVWVGVQRIVSGWPGGLLATAVLATILFSWTAQAGGWLTLTVFVALLGLFIFQRRTPTTIKLLLLWLALPLVGYLFLIMRPRDHYYVFMPPLVLLAALIADGGLKWATRLSKVRWLVPSLAGVLLVLLGLASWNQYTLFMRPDLEYMLTYPRHKNPILWNDPRFPFKVRIGWGFPYRLGWQTVSELYRAGALNGDWYANDSGNSIYWYTRGSVQNPCFPRYFMLTKYTYKTPPLSVPANTIRQYYTLRATVRVNGEPRLRLYEFTPTGNSAPPQVFDEPTVMTTPYTPNRFLGDPLGGPVFRPRTAFAPPRRFKPHPKMLAQLAEIYNDPNTVLFQEDVSLLGYDLDTTWATPGGLAILTLYWQADSPVFLPYKVFTQVGGEKMWAQADDEPGCGNYPTYTWRTGDRFIDRHVIFLPPDMPPGEYPVQVGLYEIRSGLRMDMLDEAGNPAGTALPLTTLTVAPQ